MSSVNLLELTPPVPPDATEEGESANPPEPQCRWCCCSTTPATWLCHQTIPLTDELRAKIRVAAFLHNMLKTAPCAFVARYMDRKFLVMFFLLRRKYLTLWFFGYFIFVVCILPYIYMNTLLPYPCQAISVEMRVPGDQLRVPVIIQQTNCEFQDVLRSRWSLMFGPLCLVPCLVAMAFAYYSPQRAIFERGLLSLQQYMSLSRLAFCSNGHVWFARGTGGLTTSALMKRLGIETQYHWVHDAFGAPDIVALVSVMNVSLALMLGVAPGVRSYLHKESIANAVKSVSVGLGIGLVLVRLLFALADRVLGSPNRLAEATEGILRSWSPNQLRSEDPRIAAQKFLHGLHLKDLEKDPAKRAPLLEVAERVRSLPWLSWERDAEAFREFSNSDFAGLLGTIYSENTELLSLSLEQLDALVSLNMMGVIIAMVDPEYEDMKKNGFSRRFMVKAVHLHAEGGKSGYFEEVGGTWRNALGPSDPPDPRS